MKHYTNGRYLKREDTQTKNRKFNKLILVFLFQIKGHKKANSILKKGDVNEDKILEWNN